MTLPDPVTSRAVLIGIDQYRNLPSLEPVARGRDRLAQLLQDPAVWGLHQRNVEVFDAQAGRDDILAAIKQAARATTDTLLLYFAGHGLRDRNGQQLHLALSNADDEHLQIGSIAFGDIRQLLAAGHRARRRIVLLDCCYSGLAGSMGHQDITRSELAEEAAAEGTYLLTSASSTQRAFAHDDQPYPEFTGTLIDVLEKGVPTAGPELTLNTVWQATRSALIERGSPEPHQFGQNALAELAWVTNAAYSRADSAWSRMLTRQVTELREALQATERRVALLEQHSVGLQEEVALLRERAQAHPARNEDSADLANASAAGSGENGHITIVHPGYHRPWAVWIAQRVEMNGHSAALQRWDPLREVPLKESLGDLLLAQGQVLLVLDDGFFALGPRPAGEWNHVLRGFVTAHADRFAAVNVTNRALLPATTVLDPVGLWGVDEEEAEARLLKRLGIEPRRSADRRITAGPPVRYPDTPPEIWGEVPRRNPRFTGRDEILSKVQEQLVDTERGNGTCTLLGMSGIGKTQIAVEYAHRFNSDYDVVWWVNSDDRTVQRDRFGELAVALELPVGSEPGERVRAVREALHHGRPHARWLVVFDGWDDPDGLDEILPQGSGHVLITSRNRTWQKQTEVLEVSGFDRAESTGYLMRRAPHITADEADEVAAEFADVPLVVVQAAAWLGESGMGALDYLRLVREGRLSTTDEQESGDGILNSALTSWSILIDRLRKSQPYAVDVLRLCVAFAPAVSRSASSTRTLRRICPKSCAGWNPAPRSGTRHWTH
ncbi:FxSxx-COOH system tetratricopeptide repeat protein [Streptomyces diastatochromogenes]|nr:FxSxx-COOH system tetratricopeptide repeat protein [Streptomyces diastatochromogenes]